MYDQIRSWALAILKTPAEPHPPIGDPASLRVFNAGRNYFRLRLAGWAVTQFLALAGIIFWTAFLITVEKAASAQKEARANQPAQKTPEAEPPAKSKRRKDNWGAQAAQRIQSAATDAAEPGPARPRGQKVRHVNPWAGFKQTFVELALRLPSGAFALIWAVKIVSGLIYLVQVPFTYAILRLDYEMRWYMVTDRSLRLRHGVWKVSESTMSFANVQQVVVSQGPLQRLLGLADVKVKSAGGGGDDGHHKSGTDMHTGLFRHVTNAPEIRDLILDRLRRFRAGGAGLGDPDEKTTLGTSDETAWGARDAQAIAVAREIVAEARALRAALRS